MDNEKESLPLPKATGLLRELQLAYLKLMKEVDKVFRENGIFYTLGAGSAIGAIVHHGFIPWDDDIDILMDRANYDKFVSLKDKILPKNIIFKDYFSDNSLKVLIGKIVDTSTTMITVDQYGRKTVSGVAIDVSCFDYVEKNKIKRKFQWFNSIKALILANGISPQNHGKLVKWYGNFLLKTTKDKPKKIKKLVEKIKSSSPKSGLVAEMLYLGGNKIYFDEKTFKEFIEVDFEDTKFLVTKEYDYYLKKRYQRDYTVLPPKEKRLSWHNCEYLNVSLGYEEYLKNEV